MNAYCEYCRQDNEAFEYEGQLCCAACEAPVMLCYACDKPFTAESHEGRHWHRGNEYHNDCCPKCELKHRGRRKHIRRGATLPATLALTLALSGCTIQDAMQFFWLAAMGLMAAWVFIYLVIFDGQPPKR